MSTGCGNFHATLDTFLPFNIGKIEFRKVQGFIKFGSSIDSCGFQSSFPFEEIYYFLKIFDSINIQSSDNCGFFHVLFGQKKTFETFFFGLYGNGQSSFDGLQTSVQRKFPHNNVLVNFVGLDLGRSHKNSDGESQIISRTLFSQIGRRHIDGNFLARHVVTVIFEGSCNSITAFLDGIVRQTHQMVTDSFIHIDFYGDGSRFDPKNGTSKNFYQHKK